MCTRALALWACLATATLSAADARVRLLFSVEQGFGNGIVVNGDVDAVGRIMQAIKTLRPRYDVYAIFNPQVFDKPRLEAALARAVGEEVPFFLVVQSSDGMTLGSWSPPNDAADPAHGITIRLDLLKKYKQRYGRYFAGIQFFEVFAQDFTLRAGRSTNPEWIDPHWKLPPKGEGFWQPELIRPFLIFARDEKMQVQWSDWHWTHFADWDKAQVPQEEQFKKLLADFPGLVTVCYANNEPQAQSNQRLLAWQEAMLPLVKAGAKDFGLSCQSWMERDETSTKVEELIRWSNRALDMGCTMIQFEPVWYFFKAPRGIFDHGWQLSADYGIPTERFKQLALSLKTYKPSPALPQGAGLRRPENRNESGFPAPSSR